MQQTIRQELSREKILDTVKKRISKLDEIPVIPQVFASVSRLLNDPRSSAKDFCSVVNIDPPLTAKVLKTINSAYYGLSQQIDSLERAIPLLGLNTLRNLIICSSLSELGSDGRQMHVVEANLVSHQICD